MLGINRAFRVRHHAKDVTGLVEHASNVPRRSVDIVGIAESHTIIIFQPVERLVISKIITVMMGDRNDYFLALLITGGEDRAVLCDDQLSVTADKLDILVAHQRAW